MWHKGTVLTRRQVIGGGTLATSHGGAVGIKIVKALSGFD